MASSVDTSWGQVGDDAPDRARRKPAPATPVGDPLADGSLSDRPSPDGWKLRLAVLSTAVGWFGFSLVMLLRSTIPNMGPQLRLGRGPAGHLLMAAVLAIVLAGVLALVDRWSTSTVSWNTTLITSVVIFAFELAQIPVPVRAFEMDDLVYGIAGVVLGATVAAAIMAALGRRNLSRLVAAVGFAGLIVAISVAVIRDPSMLDRAVGVSTQTIR